MTAVDMNMITYFLQQRKCLLHRCMAISGETLCRINCQLIGMSLIGLARQVQKNRD